VPRTDTLRYMTAEPVPGDLPPGQDPSPTDPRTTAGKLAQLHDHIYEAVHAGSQQAIDAQHARGKLTARERIHALLDPGSFMETDAFARHRAVDFGLDRNRPAGDGCVTGYGTVDGRPVCVFSHDVTVFGGSLGEVYGQKIVKTMDLALKTGCPVVGLNEGSGARIQEGIMGLAGYGEIFYRNVMSSGVIPQISLILGPCAGGHVYSPALTDFTLMVDKTSNMFITGPDVIKTVTGEEVGFEELGGARTHNTKSGVAHFMASDEHDCFALTKALLAYLPSNNMEEAPAYDEVDLAELEPDTELDSFMPDSSNQPYDMHKVLDYVLDDGEFLEVHALFASNIITGFGRVDGRAVGVVANQPISFAGTLDINAAEKAARFVRTCDAFNVPVLTFVDVPGFLPGTDQEWRGIIRHGAKLIYAYSEATVPKVTIITRKAYGGAYDVMGSKHLRADMNLAWPSAEIAVMGAQGAVNIVQRRALNAAAKRGEDVEALRAEFITEYADRFANPYIAAERGFVDMVIAPRHTRSLVIRALRQLRNKRESLPPKKHGNIPL
jgi:propionyl-CoA carboxylase beta chain